MGVNNNEYGIYRASQIYRGVGNDLFAYMVLEHKKKKSHLNR